MKAWNFRVNSSPNEISKKLESALGTVNGFVFNLNQEKNNSISFRVRKRVLYVWYMAFQNWTIINGELLKTDTENKTDVVIVFNQHLLIRLIVFTHIFLGLFFLITIISGISSNASLYIVGGILLAIGTVLWVAVQNKFRKDIQKYKILISGILECEK
ncbi:hypothetical protein [Sunxiuqinia rutila]|uniref:hypothetical protein n=1 Tax=Sunxiuqinia rutila TaxID=1397841 RepID=UPI003D36C280